MSEIFDSNPVRSRDLPNTHNQPVLLDKLPTTDAGYSIMQSPGVLVGAENVDTPKSFVLDESKPMHLLLRQPSCMAPKCRGSRSKTGAFPDHTTRRHSDPLFQKVQ
jgi:hypothetical protein